MIVPVKNIVETVDLTPKDALLPLFECIVNSIISLMKSTLPQNQKEIQVKVIRNVKKIKYRTKPQFCN